jgi:enoyl-CoA hydratase/carnithine racemase
VSDSRVLLERDASTGIARLTLDNPTRRNAYDPAMREQLGAYLDELAMDDEIKVVLLRGEGGVFSTGADMANAYSWYGRDAAAGDGQRPQQRPSQRRRLSVDRKTFDFYHNFMGYPKVIVAAVRGFALGGGFEMALMADISVVARDAKVGMPATRFLGPALGSLHMFFYRLGPTLARRFLLTGDTLAAEKLEHLGDLHRGHRRRGGRGARELVAPEGGADARRRHRDREGGVPPGRAAPGISGRRRWRATCSTRSEPTFSSATTSSTS